MILQETEAEEADGLKTIHSRILHILINTVTTNTDSTTEEEEEENMMMMRGTEKEEEEISRDLVRGVMGEVQSGRKEHRYRQSWRL